MPLALKNTYFLSLNTLSKPPFYRDREREGFNRKRHIHQYPRPRQRKTALRETPGTQHKPERTKTGKGYAVMKSPCLSSRPVSSQEKPFPKTTAARLLSGALRVWGNPQQAHEAKPRFVRLHALLATMKSPRQFTKKSHNLNPDGTERIIYSFSNKNTLSKNHPKRPSGIV